MTIIEAITRLDELQPNSFTAEEKVRWLEQLDRELWREVICTHEGGADIQEPCYTQGTDDDNVLLVEPPYDSIYLHWMQSRIDYALAEFGRFNNSNAAFEADRMAWRMWYHRNHVPLERTRGRYF